MSSPDPSAATSRSAAERWEVPVAIALVVATFVVSTLLVLQAIVGSHIIDPASSANSHFAFLTLPVPLTAIVTVLAMVVLRSRLRTRIGLHRLRERQVTRIITGTPEELSAADLQIVGAFARGWLALQPLQLVGSLLVFAAYAITQWGPARLLQHEDPLRDLLLVAVATGSAAWALWRYRAVRRYLREHP